MIKEYTFYDWYNIIILWICIFVCVAVGNYFAIFGWIVAFLWFMSYKSEHYRLQILKNMKIRIAREEYKDESKDDTKDS
jgi:hypothetical protein